MVRNTHEYPYSAIGLIIMYFNEIPSYGTGFLIGPNLALTCAHNCYDEKKRIEAKKLKFLPALNGPSGKIHTVGVRKVCYPNEY